MGRLVAWNGEEWRLCAVSVSSFAYAWQNELLCRVRVCTCVARRVSVSHDGSSAWATPEGGTRRDPGLISSGSDTRGDYVYANSSPVAVNHYRHKSVEEDYVRRVARPSAWSYVKNTLVRRRGWGAGAVVRPRRARKHGKRCAPCRGE